MYRLTAMLGVLVAALVIAAGSQGQDKKGLLQLRGVLPPNWGKIGLNEEQEQKVFKIQSDTKERIGALEKQIAELRGKEKQALLDVLTDEQKKKLILILEETPAFEKKE